MYARLLASDADFDGRFFTGVLTTGIYCLPSCRARKPKSENVRFFQTAEAARGAGLRPCRKCHPDDFALGADPVLESIETLVAEIRAEPSKFPDAREIVRRSGYGTTRAIELFKRHYHATPAEVLLDARVRKAKSLLLGKGGNVSDAALAAGFESLSGFHESFRRFTGMTPASFRELRTATNFEITLPPGYALDELRHALSRDISSVSERLDGDEYQLALTLGSGPEVLKIHLDPAKVTVRCPKSTALEAHAVAARILGLGQDSEALERLATRLGFARLVSGGKGMRICQTPTAFDGLVWTIVGQQINLPFTFRLRRRLFELAGTPVAGGLIAPPSPAQVASLDPRQLLALQFSRQKADYVIAVARLVLEGRLDPEAMREHSATRVERTLLGTRGLGPWSVNYIMMRSLGFADCLPIGDTGVTSSLKNLMNLETRPDADATRRLMSVFSPHRSLATAHLWRLLRIKP
jgi:AraC family transcriptional regulator of adaptative response / DNA-3-methyladenine glycosylase II